jgi:hypothetical protein
MLQFEVRRYLGGWALFMIDTSRYDFWFGFSRFIRMLDE